MSNRARRLACVAIIVLAGALTYANSLRGPIVFDDQLSIERNPSIRHLWPLADVLAAPRDNPLASRPLVNLSFAINFAIGGTSTLGYHIGTVGLHIIAALLLFAIIRRTLTSGELRERFAPAADGIALSSALIWMVHPLQTDSVDYLTQRTEVMMGVFYLLTLYCAIRAAQPSASDGWRTGAILSCLLGMGCKEAMVTAPLTVALYDRVFLYGSIRDAWQSRKTLYAGLALGWFALAALLLGSLPPTIGFGNRMSGWTYLLNQCPMILRYLWLTIWPHDLVIDYGVPHPVTLMQVLPQALLMCALAAATVAALVVRPALGFLGAWFFITLAPASSIVPVMTEVGAERRMYLPLAGLAVLIVLGGRRLFEPAAQRWIAPAAAAAVIAALAFGTIERNQEYASVIRLLRTTVERWPQSRSEFNLGGALKDEGRIDEALVYMRAVQAEQPRALYEIGLIMYDRGQFDEAIVALRAYVSRLTGKPEDTASQRVIAQNLLALSFGQQRKLPE